MASELPDRLEDIPHDSDLYQQLVQLGKLAFEGRVREEVIFKELPEGCSNLGLLVEHRALYTRKESKNYNFFHLTLQEYLGAFYISQLPANEQRTLFIEHKKYKHLRVVWMFVAGLTKMQNIGWDVFKREEGDKESGYVVQGDVVYVGLSVCMRHRMRGVVKVFLVSPEWSITISILLPMMFMLLATVCLYVIILGM